MDKPLLCIVTDHMWWLQVWPEIQVWCADYDAKVYHDGIVFMPDEFTKELFIMRWDA
jgi:hypothetical protein